MSLTTLKFPLENKLMLPVAPVPFLHCNWLAKNEGVPTDLNLSFSPTLAISPVTSVEIKSACILTEGNDVKNKIELTLDKKDFHCDYLPGDTIGIYPRNSPVEVSELIECLDLKKALSDCFKVEILKETTKKIAAVPKHLTGVTSLRNLLSQSLEIRSPIKKTLLRALCSCTADISERRRLEELCSKEGSEDYNRYILNSKLTLLTILKTFKTCKPPIALILEHVPPMKPRIYSIASSPLKDNNLLRIVVTVVENENVKGVCSGYLCDFVPLSSNIESKLDQLSISDENHYDKAVLQKVPMFFRQPNSFRYPVDPLVNQILISAGSGIAPFIGFLEHKEALKEVTPSESSETWLFFGCRNDNDYIYRKELERFLSERILNKLFVSFSRLPSENTPSYVQDNIHKVKEEYIDFFVSKEASIFICGDALNMVKEVVNMIKICLQEVKGISMSDAENQVKEYIKNGRIKTDAWV